jgi:hypothetical protein
METNTQRNVLLGTTIGLGALTFWDKPRQTFKSWFGMQEEIHVTVDEDDQTETVTV